MSSLRSTLRSDALLLWLACAVAACAAAVLVFGVFGAAIAEAQARAGAIGATRIDDERIIAQRPQLEHERAAIESRLSGLALREDRAGVVADFIRIASRVAAAHRVDVAQIDEPSADSPPGQRAGEAVQPRTAEVDFEQVPLDVVLTGTYSDLLAAIRDLAAARVAMRIEIASLDGTAASGAGPAPPLTAHLHVEVEHLPDAPAPAAPSSLPEETQSHARSD